MWQGRHGIAYIYKQNVHSQSRRFMAMAMAMDGKQGKKNSTHSNRRTVCVCVCVCLFLVCIEFEFESWPETKLEKQIEWREYYQEFDFDFHIVLY